MLMDIILESLLYMDEDTRDYVLESCTDDELEIISEAVSEKSAAILKRGYKVGTGRHMLDDLSDAGIHLDPDHGCMDCPPLRMIDVSIGDGTHDTDKWQTASLKDIGKYVVAGHEDRRLFRKGNLKNIAGDLKVDGTRIINNLKGNGKEVSDMLSKTSSDSKKFNDGSISKAVGSAAKHIRDAVNANRRSTNSQPEKASSKLSSNVARGINSVSGKITNAANTLKSENNTMKKS